jgi:hypothetical protein
MHLQKSVLVLLVWLDCIIESTFAFSSSAVRQGVKATQLHVASTEPISVANMQRGIGGRIENAFEAAKERGEAAFVTFVTAGYPRAQGKQNPFTEHESG